MEDFNFNIKLKVTPEVLKEVLKERGLETSKANMQRIIKVMKEKEYGVNEKFFCDIPYDKETLLMYGCTFKK